MRKLLLMSIVLIGFGLSGCAVVGKYGFTDVDLNGNLTPQSLNRYESEWKAIQAGGEAGGCMAQLELTNWWPLGLILYWDRGSVMRSETADGPTYMVSKAWGLGPLCIVYVTEDMATFDAKGRRLSGMGVWNCLLGMVGMVHSGDAILANGQRQTMSAGHLAHHLLAYHTMDGHTQISMLTGPNPVGFDMHSMSSMPAGSSGYAAALPPLPPPSAAIPAPAAPIPALSTLSPAAPAPAAPVPALSGSPAAVPAPDRLVAPAPAALPSPGVSAREEIVYTCSMHPEVVQATPGNCPKCRMRLIPRKIALRASQVKP